ncbi:MAG: hypothetical protein GY726_07940, partial [Proteobacteria bacterium]|nr:hypothetical protein [Pseudomonadota bacterium]
VVHVGHGIIKNELEVSRRNQDIQAYSEYGLFATWAEVAPRYMESVEAYLAHHYEPKLAWRNQGAEPLPIELP